MTTVFTILVALGLLVGLVLIMRLGQLLDHVQYMRSLQALTEYKTIIHGRRTQTGMAP
jgi:uncharacterized membrane protein